MRLYSSWNIGGTETYRWSASKNISDQGLNLQTMPKAMRYILVPEPGRVFVSGDLGQAEARVVAYLANCKDLIALFNDPTRHVHMENALAVFGHAVEKDSPEYVLAKAVVHASNYREGPYKFSVQTGMPIRDTKRLLSNYHAKRPEIGVWHKWVWNEIKDRGMLRSPLGDERFFYEAVSSFSLLGKMTDQQWKDAIAWVPQTTVPHITNIGFIGLASVQAELDLWFHHHGHDSFLVSVPEGMATRVVDAAQKAFCVDLVASGQHFGIPMEFSVGWNFGDMMAWHGKEPSKNEWQVWLAHKLQKKSREEQLLESAYGIHLKNWRVV